MRYLGLEDTPFGTGKAETDTLLLTCRVDPPCLENLRRPQPTLCIGAPGSGKTATALLLAYDSLREQKVFPVYYPAALETLQLDQVAQALARTLLRYLAVTPTGFLRRRVAGKTAIAHLLALYARPNLALRFHQAGLPTIGDGADMLRQIEELIQGGEFQEPLTYDECFVLLSEARPHGFRCTMILLDVQEQAGEGDDAASGARVRWLLNLSDALARVGVFVKAFLPDKFHEHLDRQSGQPLVVLHWPDDDLNSDNDLAGLLENRLASRATGFDRRPEIGDDTLATWCKSRERDLSPDSRLVKAAQGKPGVLIRKGNELLRRIGQKQGLLTAPDLDDILGSLPA